MLVVGVSEQLAAKETRDEPCYPTRQPPVVPEINISCTSYPMYNKLKRKRRREEGGEGREGGGRRGGGREEEWGGGQRVRAT